MSKKTFLSCLLVLSSIHVQNTCEGCDTAVNVTTSTPVQSTAKHLHLGANVVTQGTVKVAADRALIYIRNEDSQPMTVVFAPQKITNDPSIKDLRKAGDMIVTIPANSFIGMWVKRKDLGDSINLFQVEVYDDKIKATNPESYNSEWVGDNLVYGQVYLLTYKQQNPFTPTCNIEVLREPIKDFPNQVAQGVEVRKDFPTSGN
jgi:hypothetical protein